ncbi:hypothetical protein K7X08_003754 [Anisodus acutangulus]|uniref:Uncharacterized protein n=1 Tax=Anisodus acutangulus TaxID=402998 RepID=A0A9Q1RJZ1_9SOLA|nr:hypothetical protein K7X08_003754 [Anisodus acutangulus]
MFVQLCVFENLCPETVDEGIAMVPPIKNRGRALDEEAIEKMLTDLSLIKKFDLSHHRARLAMLQQSSSQPVPSV